MGEQEREKEFRVSDHRRFSAETDEVRDIPRRQDHKQDQGVKPQPEAHPEDFQVTFTGFILGLSSQALMYLGQVQDPQGGPSSTNLPAAQQMIDILSLLNEKTHGNLEKSEEDLLERILFDLRTKFVEIAKN